MSLTVEHNGKIWETDYKGFLLVFTPDDMDWRDYIRMKDGIPELTSEHIEILEYFQDFYRKNGIYPNLSSRSIKKISKELNKSFNYICKLFPSENPFLTIIVMAGLPNIIGTPVDPWSG